ncbi:MAG: hypothetical protein M3326_09400 [Actinomycetota bacterium]|nr:hypothetical protein [Actinomycetota bacterium]
MVRRPGVTGRIDLDTAAPAGDLLEALAHDPRFRKDSVLGGLFHLGWVSYRELSPTESLHVVIRGDRVSAHVDDISPLVLRPDGSYRYAWGRVVVHNLLVIVGDVARRVRGLQGRQRCNLRCQVEVVEED